MRIGYVVPEFPSQTHAFFWRELSAMRQQGHDVHVFSTSRPPVDSCRHEFASAARAETTYLLPPTPRGVIGTLVGGRSGALAAARHVAACKFDSSRDAARLMGIALCAAELVSQARRRDLDHVHIHSCADAAHLGAIGHLLGGPPFSLTLHGDLPVYGRNHPLKMTNAKFVSAVTRPLQRQVMQEIGWPESRVPVIWMGVDTQRFAPPERQATSSDFAPPVRLLTVARLNGAKGHRYALRAIRRAIDDGVPVQYVIAGSGPEQAAIENEIRELGLQSVVEMTGTVSEGTVLELLHRSDVFVLPSLGLGEAAPVSVMEAMACGLPVISSIIGGTPDMITHGVDGLLVEQADLDGLTSAIRDLARDQGYRAKLGQSARGRAVEAFDYRENARKLAAQMQS